LISTQLIKIKSFFVKKSLEKYKNVLAYCRSVTTREKRPKETDENYIFTSKQKFEKMIQKNDFFEFNNYVNNLYGTSKTEINNAFKKENFLNLIPMGNFKR